MGAQVREKAKMRPQAWLMAGAVLAALAVGCGAYGAHGLEKRLRGMGRSEERVAKDSQTYQAAVLYQMHHAVGLMLVGALGLARRSRVLDAAGWCFLAGISLFSGLLFVSVLSGKPILAPLVPVGGVALIIGWLVLAVAAGMWRDSGPRVKAEAP
jgi:uncharacterized membrane protein YgdD (TMEM256/DUF423 family)